MISSRKFFYLFCVVVVIIFTYQSYRGGEKFYFLIPLILMPIFEIQRIFFIPIYQFNLAPENMTFKGVDISSFKSISRIIVFVENAAATWCLTGAFLHAKIFRYIFMYSCFFVFIKLFSSLYLTIKFYREEKKQGVIKTSESFSQLFTKIRSQFKKFRIQKIEAAKKYRIENGFLSRRRYYFYCFLIASVCTYFSYREGEKLYFLIPLILLPIDEIHRVFLIPIFQFNFISEDISFKGIDISNFKSTSRKILYLECAAMLCCLIFAIVNRKILSSVIMYTSFTTCNMLFFSIYLPIKFYREEKTQHLFKNSESLGQLTAEINSQYEKYLLRKYDSHIESLSEGMIR